RPGDRRGTGASFRHRVTTRRLPQADTAWTRARASRPCDTRHRAKVAGDGHGGGAWHDHRAGRGRGRADPSDDDAGGFGYEPVGRVPTEIARSSASRCWDLSTRRPSAESRYATN